MKEFIYMLKSLAFLFTIILVLFYWLGWLFHCDTDNIFESLKYASFSYLVLWFINLLFIKPE